MPKFKAEPGTIQFSKPPGPGATEAEIEAWKDSVRALDLGLDERAIDAMVERAHKAEERERRLALFEQRAGFPIDPMIASNDASLAALELAVAIMMSDQGRELGPDQVELLEQFARKRNKKDAGLGQGLGVARLYVEEGREKSLNERIAQALGRLAYLNENFEEHYHNPERRTDIQSNLARTFGQISALIREKKNWNQREIASVLGVRQATVSRWELGQSAPEGTARVKLIALARDTLSGQGDLPDNEASVSFIEISLRAGRGGAVTAIIPGDRRVKTPAAIPFVQPIARTQTTRAILIDTDEFKPRYDRGDVVVAVGRRSWKPSDVDGLECYVELIDGSMLLGVVTSQGDNRVDFYVEGHPNAPAIVHASPVVTVVRAVALNPAELTN